VKAKGFAVGFCIMCLRKVSVNVAGKGKCFNEIAAKVLTAKSFYRQ